jgi:hypothetical protein
LTSQNTVEIEQPFCRLAERVPRTFEARSERYETAVTACHADGDHGILRGIWACTLARDCAQHERRTSNGQCDDR